MQNCAAKLVYGRRKRDRVSDLFLELHWLRIRERIIYKIILRLFKIILVVFKCIHDSAPVYLRDLISNSTLSTGTLRVPKALTAYGDRSFDKCGPKLWNALPFDLRSISSIHRFKKLLKHYFFVNHDTYLNKLNAK